MKEANYYNCNRWLFRLACFAIDPAPLDRIWDTLPCAYHAYSLPCVSALRSPRLRLILILILHGG